VRRRLLLVIVGTVALALSVAAAASFFGITRSDRIRTAASLTLSAQRLSGSGQAERYDGLLSVKEALGLTTASVWSFADPAKDVDKKLFTTRFGLTAVSDPDKGVDGKPLQVGGASLAVTEQILPSDLATLAAGKTVEGIFGREAYASVRVKRNADFVTVLLLSRPLPNTPTQALYAIALSSIGALIIAAFAAAAFARRISRPLTEVMAAQSRIASGDLSVRVTDDRSSTANAAKRRDEIGGLLRDLDRMAEALGRARNQERQFLLSVSHDLRTPLTSIRGFAEAMADGSAPDPQRAAQIIASESRRLERLVRDLLELAKLESKNFTLQIKNVDLTDLVTDTADGFLPRAEQDNLVLTLDAAEQVTIQADPERLQQAMANLIENACKFARSSVHIALVTDGQWATISIADDGPGISPEDLPHVFDRMYTSDRRPTREIGSGLGLAIVRELIEAMGATVEPRTSPEGTTFSLRLPSTLAR
jgi:signal transduction histidine kinase